MNIKPKRLKVLVNEQNEITQYGELVWNNKEWVITGSNKEFINGVLQYGIYYPELEKQVYLNDY